MLAVVKIFEYNFEVGAAVWVSSWADAYQVAENLVLNEFEARGIDTSGDTKMILEIQKSIQAINYYCVNIGGEEGKAVAIQIIELKEST